MFNYPLYTTEVEGMEGMEGLFSTKQIKSKNKKI